MAVLLKRPAAVLNGDHATATATATQESAKATRCKRSRVTVGSTDDYVDSTCIGAGGFGAVFRARHRVTGKIVAIKHLNSEGANAGELLREARFLQLCSGNPYVVGFEGLARDPRTGNLCFVMEYVEAPSLNDFFWDTRHGPRLPEPTVRAFMWKLLTRAKMMHERHVVHRDIKPANILVGAAEQEGGGGDRLLKMCDLGLAISMTDAPPYNQAGTLNYMAPEMLLQKTDYDAIVDTWSLGCVMAELVTGEALFDDEQEEDEDDDDERESESLTQLRSIFSVLGVPSEKSWPEFTSLPLAGEALRALPAMVRPHQSKLREMFPEETLSADGFKVLEGLLTCNPARRLTAAAALKLPWFAPLRPAAAAAAKINAPAFPTKKPQKIKIIPPATPQKKPPTIKIIPPVIPEKKPTRIKIIPFLPAEKKLLRIKIIPPEMPDTRIY
ncbi:putative cyclin-dependent kinase F-2 [Brachypodium distachyon]|uniref:[RNA-polymerase]-subunit kinase n=1 Tax=Brachypodium distachyon TaxID=15368 RepID=I1H8H9_BRADI|nr:putative cyclin-dependent kinase F-2 [Brachypodium distachyon]KQK23075.1 hypothetical protein BRADI_1g71140v3 [Brachypodium distachyon]|eukprot:XP_003561939.1 putative cyclin-dependent kinase F-2 [Brachypodium distachyon]